jgi:hypothetical protein
VPEGLAAAVSKVPTKNTGIDTVHHGPATKSTAQGDFKSTGGGDATSTTTPLMAQAPDDPSNTSSPSTPLAMRSTSTGNSQPFSTPDAASALLNMNPGYDETQHTTERPTHGEICLYM